MPEFKSAYDIYFAAGADPGKYEASKFGIQDIWSGIEFGEKSTEVRLEHISNITDSLMASVELGSTLYQGTLDRREFAANLETVQASEAKKAFQMLPEAERAVGFSEYIKSDVGKEWYGGFRAEAVGSPGLFGKKEGDETWEDLEWWEKLGQEKRYKFGGEDILTRSQVSATALSSAYGIETDFDVFRQQLGEDRGGESMAEEVGIVEEPAGEPGTSSIAAPPTSMDENQYEMLSRMASTFKENDQAPILADDLKHLQPWLDQIAKSRGWKGTSWSKETQ